MISMSLHGSSWHSAMPTCRCLLLFGETPTDAQIESAARNAARTFLRAYAPAQANALAVKTA